MGGVGGKKNKNPMSRLIGLMKRRFGRANCNRVRKYFFGINLFT